MPLRRQRRRLISGVRSRRSVRTSPTPLDQFTPFRLPHPIGVHHYDFRLDRIGVLYRITRALAEMMLDIRTAKVATLGHEVVDTFYVRDIDGQKITDEATQREIERAIQHGLA